MPAINRQWEVVQLLSFEGTDAYGQLKQENSSTDAEPISVVWKIFNQTNITNPNYVDVEVIALTIADVTTENQILKDGVKYNVKFVIPGRYNQVFLSRC